MLTKLLKDWVIQIIAVSATGQTDRKFLLYFMGINILLVFQKNVIFSISFSLTNALQFQMEASYLLNYLCGTLSPCHFTKDDILRIINNLDPNKVHCHDEILMLKICGDSICRPINIIFKTCWRMGKFLLKSKKANIVSIHKGDQQTVKNYHLVLILSIFGKIFERLLYNGMLNFFQKMI